MTSSSLVKAKILMACHEGCNSSLSCMELDANLTAFPSLEDLKMRYY